MIDQALTAKRLYAIGVGYSDSTDPVAAGLSISLFQDSVEHLVWGICKHLDVSAKDSESFVSLLEKVELATGNTVTGKARILELNKARVAFKHYGILPNPTEATKFRAYTYDFLVLACERYLGLEFDNLTELSLISDPQVRKHIENGKVARESGKLSEAMSELSIARYLAFQVLQVYIPKVDSRIHDVDRLLSRIPGVVGSVAPFRYLAEHQESLGKFIVAALIGGNIGEHLQFDRILPRVRRYDAGNLETSIQTHLQLTEELVDRTLRYVTSTALKVQELGKSA